MTQLLKKIRLGAGAGFAGDRIDPAVEVARAGNVDYLIFECLAERTIALAQQQRLQDPTAGFDTLLENRMRQVLPWLRDGKGKRRFRIISNMGAANPLAAQQAVIRIASELGLHGLKVAAVQGDDVLEKIRHNTHDKLDNGMTIADLGERLISANAYLGVAGLIKALQQDADVIISGRVADPSLYLAPQIFSFGWDCQDWDALARGTLVGHLLECAGQISGGYFADPGFKDVDDLAHLGFPIAEVAHNGHICLTKVAGSGGRITPSTCSEQLMYEIHDPTAYITPDIVADFSHVSFTEEAPDQVMATGARGKPAPQTLKVSVGYLDGYIGTGEISYGGPGALQRAELARSILLQRIDFLGVAYDDIRTDLIGVDSLYGKRNAIGAIPPREVRLRLAARCQQRCDAEHIGREVEALYTNGPAGGGGAVKTCRQVMAVASTYWPAHQITPSVHLETAK